MECEFSNYSTAFGFTNAYLYMRDREQNTVFLILAQLEMLAEREHRLLVHNCSERIIDSVIQSSHLREAVSEDTRGTTFVCNICWAREMESSPFRPVSLLGEELLIASLNPPSLELGIVLLASFVQIPFDTRAAISAYPLAYEYESKGQQMSGLAFEPCAFSPFTST